MLFHFAILLLLNMFVEIESQQSYASYQFGIVCHPESIQTPSSSSQIIQIVQNAISANKKVKAFGNRHSITDIICSDGVAISMENFKETLILNPDNTVNVSAGYAFQELNAFLHENGRSLSGGPSWGGITVGGAVGTGAHGSSLKYETTLSANVVGLRIIDGLGNIRFISSASDLQSYRVHLGLLGIILELVIRTEPDFKVLAEYSEVSDAMLTNGQWEPFVRNSDYATFWWFAGTGRLIKSNETRVPVTTPGNAAANFGHKTTDEFNEYTSKAMEILHAGNIVQGLQIAENLARAQFTSAQSGVIPIYTEDGFTIPDPTVGFRHLMQDSLCGNQCIWEHSPHNIYFMDNHIPIDIMYFEEAVTTIKDILSKYQSTFFQVGFWIRFIRSSDALLATNYGRETVVFEFYTFQRKELYEKASAGLAAHQAIQQAMVFAFNGRPHWGKNGLYYISRPMIQRRPNIPAFVASMTNADPNRVFVNKFGERMLNISDATDDDPLTTHCALLDNCLCATNADCATGQYCGRITGYPDYPVCKNVVNNVGILNPLVLLLQPFLSLVNFFKAVVLFQ